MYVVNNSDGMLRMSRHLARELVVNTNRHCETKARKRVGGLESRGEGGGRERDNRRCGRACVYWCVSVLMN